MTNTDREKIKEALEAIVPDAELNAAWGNANFGHDDKRSVIMDTLWKVVCGYGTGSTALCICTDLKLIKGYRTRRGDVTLTKRGQYYFREAAYPRASQADTKPAGGEWLPIETCPKDSTWFLGLIEGIPYKCKAFMNGEVVNYHWCMHANMASGQTLRIERDDDGIERRIQIREADEPRYEPKILAYKLGMNHIPTMWMPYTEPLTRKENWG